MKALLYQLSSLKFQWTLVDVTIKTKSFAVTLKPLWLSLMTYEIFFSQITLFGDVRFQC